MREYDLYINAQKIDLGLYMLKGASLTDFADPKEWIFGGTVTEDLLPRSVVAGVEANGHAFRNMD